MVSRIYAPISPALDLCDQPPAAPSLLASLAEEQTLPHIVAIALGSNLGDRFANIEHALRLLENPCQLLDPSVLGDNAQLEVVDTSFLYETAPMYVPDQPSFINGACMVCTRPLISNRTVHQFNTLQVHTNIQPRALLSLLKKIEAAVGRVPSFRNGPRAVDLDILLYDGDVIDTRAEDDRRDLNNLEGHLVVPHPRMQEREFVLRPLSE